LIKLLDHFFQLLTDALLVAVAWALAFWLRFNFDIPSAHMGQVRGGVLLVMLVYALALELSSVYRHVWRFAGMAELRQLALGISLGALVVAWAAAVLRPPDFPRSVLVLHPLLVLVLLGGARAAWRSVAERLDAAGAPTQGVVVVGSLKDSAEALQSIRASREWRAVAIASPVREEVGRSVSSVRVAGIADHAVQIARVRGAQALLMARSDDAPAQRGVLLAAAQQGLAVMAIPAPHEWTGEASALPRPLELEDLLGRQPVQLDAAGLSHLLAGQTVLVTGGGGSIGSELCVQLARLGVARLVCVDSSEHALYQIERTLRAAHPQLQGRYYTANVREYARLDAICQQYRPVVVLHAAAYKHVPLMEEHNEVEALHTNVLGTLHAARAAGRVGASRFVLVSTDKAVNPTSVMGASKRLAERVVQAQVPVYPETRFLSVRFGNVLGSSGSVVPLFSEQIDKGGPVTVTHPDIVRYFMTIPEAAQLVLQAGWMGQSGQIFVLEMGEPVKIAELARLMIRLAGKSEREVPIVYTGLRPGEKLYEELLASDESTLPTPHPKLRIAKVTRDTVVVEVGELEAWLVEAGPMPAPQVMRAWLREKVPEYCPRGEV
jgi:FlaA1/EpsC-like NDP-sugar epimerase